MRVISGSARGRRLIAPSGTKVRPTADRVREAMFNRLDSLGLLKDATVLDLFAGSGALGIEALSRGAASVTFVDHDVDAVLAVEANLVALGLAGQVHRMTVDRFLQRDEADFDLALLDPPYEFAEWGHLLERLPARTALIESGEAIELPISWAEIRTSRYGRAYVAVIKRDIPRSSAIR